MKKVLIFCFILIGIEGCATISNKTSIEVIEYKSTEEMNLNSNCESLGGVAASYNVFMTSPWGRKRTAHAHLKNAASEKGANAVIMTSNNWGTITDQVQGVAYKCTYGRALTSKKSDNSPDLYEELTKLEDLRKKGILTNEEFQTQKKKLLDKK